MCIISRPLMLQPICLIQLRMRYKTHEGQLGGWGEPVTFLTEQGKKNYSILTYALCAQNNLYFLLLHSLKLFHFYFKCYSLFKHIRTIFENHFLFSNDFVVLPLWDSSNLYLT